MKPISRPRRTITAVAAVGMIALAGMGVSLANQSEASAADSASSDVGFTVKNPDGIRSLSVNGECKTTSPVYRMTGDTQLTTNIYGSGDCSGASIKTCSARLPENPPAYLSYYVDTCEWHWPGSDPSSTATATPDPTPTTTAP